MVLSMSKQETQKEQTFVISHSYYYLLSSMVFYDKLQSNFPNSHPPVLFDECINFLLFAFSCGNSWLTTAWLISGPFFHL